MMRNKHARAHTQPIHDDEKQTYTIDHHYWWSKCNYKGCSPKHNRLKEKPNTQFDRHVFTSSSESIPPLQAHAFKATPQGQKCTSEVVLVYTVPTPELCWSKGSSQGIKMLTSKVLTLVIKGVEKNRHAQQGQARVMWQNFSVILQDMFCTIFVVCAGVLSPSGLVPLIPVLSGPFHNT